METKMARVVEKATVETKQQGVWFYPRAWTLGICMLEGMFAWPILFGAADLWRQG